MWRAWHQESAPACRRPCFAHGLIGMRLRGAPRRRKRVLVAGHARGRRWLRRRRHGDKAGPASAGGEREGAHLAPVTVLVVNTSGAVRGGRGGHRMGGLMRGERRAAQRGALDQIGRAAAVGARVVREQPAAETSAVEHVAAAAQADCNLLLRGGRPYALAANGANQAVVRGGGVGSGGGALAVHLVALARSHGHRTADRAVHDGGGLAEVARSRVATTAAAAA
mmetsp:Transcript_58892/g.135088  ORF Transcript_58892/g.135088 Transcript_58892/m.135088 type:complete len:224 (+) Transcript_58892:434-1105(+)